MRTSGDDYQDFVERKKVILDGFVDSISMDGSLLDSKDELLAILRASQELAASVIAALVDSGVNIDKLMTTFLKSVATDVEHKLNNAAKNRGSKEEDEPE